MSKVSLLWLLLIGTIQYKSLSRGSKFADYVLSYFISPHPTSATPSPSPPSFFRFLQSLGIQTAAFEELTTLYMKNFNKNTPNLPGVTYYSFGASFTPTWGSVFRTSHAIIESEEGPNDGLVSVQSAVWGEYKGTIRNVNHLDIINWVCVCGVLC
jgi:triacylglycerol lipase